jgi:hypothetical protein
MRPKLKIVTRMSWPAHLLVQKNGSRVNPATIAEKRAGRLLNGMMHQLKSMLKGEQKGSQMV